MLVIYNFYTWNFNNKNQLILEGEVWIEKGRMKNQTVSLIRHELADFLCSFLFKSMEYKLGNKNI